MCGQLCAVNNFMSSLHGKEYIVFTGVLILEIPNYWRSLSQEGCNTAHNTVYT